MKIIDLLNHPQFFWQTDSQRIKDNASLSQWKLLSHSDSLTQKLHQITNGKIEHQMLSLNNSLPHPSEMDYMKIDQPAWIRQTAWSLAQKIFVYTRTIIPEKTAKNSIGKELLNTQHNPIGKILFANTNITRSKFEFAYINYNDQPIFGRRSIFNLEHSSLLVNEFFMPEMFNYLEALSSRTQ